MRWTRVVAAMAVIAVVMAAEADARADDDVVGPPRPGRSASVRVRVAHANGLAGHVRARDPESRTERDLCELPCDTLVPPGTWLDITWADARTRSRFVDRTATPGETIDLVVRDEHSTLHYVGAGILTAAAVAFAALGAATVAGAGKGYGGGVAEVVGGVFIAHGVIFGGVAAAMFATSGTLVERRDTASPRPTASVSLTLSF